MGLDEVKSERCLLFRVVVEDDVVDEEDLFVKVEKLG